MALREPGARLERGKGDGHQVMTVFLLHICSEVNTLTGIAPSIWLLLSSPLPSGFSKTERPGRSKLEI